MNLYRIGDTVINVDRVNGIVDHQNPAGPGDPGVRRVLRVLFDNTHIDLDGQEAEVFRRWFRHTARNLTPHRDEDGEELVSPEDQVRKELQHLIVLIDRARPRNRVARQAAHHLWHLVDQLLTGELRPARAEEFSRTLSEAHDDPPS
jgi:hypothetical protein